MRIIREEIDPGAEYAGSRAQELRTYTVDLKQASDPRADEALEEALAVARGIDNAPRRNWELRAAAAALAQVGELAAALNTLGPQGLSDFLGSLANWDQSLEEVEPGLSVAVLREPTRIISWVQPGWRPIYEILTKD